MMDIALAVGFAAMVIVLGLISSAHPAMHPWRVVIGGAVGFAFLGYLTMTGDDI